MEYLHAVHFRNLISDRDGTVNNYCGRYLSAIQSAYNAVFLTRFARGCTDNAVVLTSASLEGGGLRDVNCAPEEAFIYAGSKGREYCRHGRSRGSKRLPWAQRVALRKLNGRLAAVLDRPEYRKFSLIGSGFQRKFGQTTIARQDIGLSVPPEESLRFLAAIEMLVADIDPRRGFFRIEDTGRDIEIMLTVGSSGEGGGVRDFDKGDGVRFLDRKLRLGIGTGPNLVCGDTMSDVPVVEACAGANGGTRVVFVTRDDTLKHKVWAAVPEALVVDEPDTLVAVLDGVAKRERKA
jgi:hypothetical protein